MKADRYIKLESVGGWLDLKTGFIFPMLKNGIRETNKDMSVHLQDCDYEWWESLKGIDKLYVGVWLKNCANDMLMEYYNNLPDEEKKEIIDELKN